MDRKGSLERYHPPRRADDDLSNAFENMRVDDGYHNVGRGRGSHREHPPRELIGFPLI